VQTTAPVAFTLTGSGQLPRDSQNPDQGAQSAPNAAAGGVTPATENTQPGKGLDNPLDPEGQRDPWGKYKWWILAALILLLAAAAGVLLRKPVPAPAGAVPLPDPERTPQQRTLLAIKEELFALESERLTNTISESDYITQKAALETVLKRALVRNETNQGA